MSEVNEKIKQTIEENDVVLYMKGNKSMPQCGFSSKVAGVLNYIGVDYEDINVLADDLIRQGIKSFSDWPTIPQLYVKGEFVGGCDIITEMALSGELDSLFEKNGIEPDFSQDLVVQTLKANLEMLSKGKKNIDDIIAGVTTPGGITEQLNKELNKTNAIAAWQNGLDDLIKKNNQ